MQSQCQGLGTGPFSASIVVEGSVMDLLRHHLHGRQDMMLELGAASTTKYVLYQNVGAECGWLVRT